VTRLRDDLLAPYWHEVALIALTLAVSYAIVFASGFDPEGDERPEGILQHPLSETAAVVTSYVDP
jgi:uncharacterized membrane protein